MTQKPVLRAEGECACVAQMARAKIRGHEWPSLSQKARHLWEMRSLEMHRGRRLTSGYLGGLLDSPAVDETFGLKLQHRLVLELILDSFTGSRAVPFWFVLVRVRIRVRDRHNGKSFWPTHTDSHKHSSIQSFRSLARSYGTRTLRGTRSRLALRRMCLRGFTWNAGRRPRVATAASGGRFMTQLIDWEGMLGNKRPTGIIPIFGPLRFTATMKLRKELLPCRGFCPGAERRRLVRHKTVFDLCYYRTSCSASQAHSSMHFQRAHHPHVHRSL
jgi:hypothetical protein